MRLPLLAALAAVSLSLPVQAGPLADAATAVESALAANDFDAWQAANDTLLETAWAAPGLHFDRVVLTATQGGGFGGFTPRANATYARGEDILIYTEPKGYGYADLGNGLYEIAFDIDLRLLDKAGTVLLEAPNFMVLSTQMQGQSREFVGNLSANLGPDAPAGDYVLEFTFRDRNGGDSASFTTDVTLQ